MIEVVKGSTTKIIKATAPLPNNNSFLLLADDHGPRKSNKNNTNTTTITTTTDTAPPSKRTYTISERSLNKQEKQDQN